MHNFQCLECRNENDLFQLAQKEKLTGKELDAWAVIRHIEENKSSMDPRFLELAGRCRTGELNVFVACSILRVHLDHDWRNASEWHGVPISCASHYAPLNRNA